MKMCIRDRGDNAVAVDFLSLIVHDSGTVHIGVEDDTQVLSLIHIFAGQLAADGDIQMMFAAEIGQFPFDDRIQFLDDQHFIQAVQKFQRQFFRKRMRRGHLQKFRGKLSQDFPGIFIACLLYTSSDALSQ